MTLIKISITSDPVCPWCYIAYRRLLKAIALFQKTYPGARNDEIRITWKPYFLDRDAPMESVPYLDRMIQKLGDADKVPGAQAHLRRLGLQDGIQFRFGGRIGNTLRAHQLILWSELQDSANERQTSEITNAVVQALFQAHFEEERDICDVETLVRIAAQACPGLDVDGLGLRAWLETGRGVARIEWLADQARAEGLLGVPYFQMGEGEGGKTLNGAQDVNEFLETLVAYKEGSSTTTTATATATTDEALGNTC
ncbi:thioredoxin-like protein [Aspergillus heteromorphus CBS 117.55]|uniref:Thioredoxin-like protein n=1 Tax=Aspergillus heteromorphus CBS 117.55 TaxID=1448321 RepID=A0A317W851_9EURO|nr:thioredoxin-like protein [Aspergillus heteromorphus CBS 117.55]PWY81891.1 thioredoxin-like protein [Aspergillus heteromorphus CBS 117.55]